MNFTWQVLRLRYKSITLKISMLPTFSEIIKARHYSNSLYTTMQKNEIAM